MISKRSSVVLRTWTLWMLLELIYGQVKCNDTVITDQEEHPYHYQKLNVTHTHTYQ